MRNKYRVLHNAKERAYTLQRQSFFGWWRFVDANGEVYTYDHFAWGNRQDTFASREGAERRIQALLKREEDADRRYRESRAWTRAK